MKVVDFGSLNVQYSFSSDDLEYFVGILEDEESSDALRELAEHIVQFYFSYPAEQRSQYTAYELCRLRARDDLTSFARYVFDYEPATHHAEIIKALEDPNRMRVLIVAPPNSAKSTYASLIWPTFYMAKYPNKCNVMLGEGFGQVDKWGQQIREMFEGETEWGIRLHDVFPETRINKAGWTKERLYLANRTKPVAYPNLFLAGMGSTSIQGTRADMIVLDDITGPDKARSDTELQKQRDDLHNMVMKRLNPDGRVIVICTRWGANDMAPTFIKDLNFEVLHMPALVEDEPNGAYVDFIPSTSYLRYPQEGDKVKFPQWVPHEQPELYLKLQLQEALVKANRDGFRAEITTSVANMGRECLRKFLHKDRDDVLWPERFSKAALIQDRNASPISFRLVQQGDPTGVTGDVFKRDWFRYFGRDQTITQVPREVRIYQTVDPSVGQSKKGRGDFFVNCVVAIDRYGNKYILDVYRDKILPPLQREEVQRMYKENPETIGILIESVNYQAALFHELANMNVPVFPYDAKKQKDLKLEASSFFYKQGKVFLPIDAPWVEEFVGEFTQYPRGKHDDQIDAMANLLEWLSLHFDFDAEEEAEVGFEVLGG